MKNNKGIISVTAISVFALIIVFVLLIQNITTEIYRNIKIDRNQAVAQDISDSIIQYLLLQLEDQESGFNTGKINCAYRIPGMQDNLDEDNFGFFPPHCNPDQGFDFDNNLRHIIGENEVYINFEIQGRHPQDQTIATTYEPYQQNYLIPSPGTGSAGNPEICNLYTPNFQNNAFVDESLTAIESVDQLDYSCNWNRLTLGSTATDRVSIPLYHTDTQGNLTQPFLGQEARDQDLFIRFRTPCNCQDNQNGCSPKDPTVCQPFARYALPGFLQDRNQDIVAQWQISSPDCGNAQECTIVGVGGGPRFTTVISNERIGEYIGDQTLSLVSRDRHALSLTNNEISRLLPRGVQPGILPTMQQPLLKLLINDRLIDANNQRVPYLEYQVLTSQPVSFEKKQISISVDVNGNTYKYQQFIDLKTPTVDFAIQN